MIRVWSAGDRSVLPGTAMAWGIGRSSGFRGRSACQEAAGRGGALRQHASCQRRWAPASRSTWSRPFGLPGNGARGFRSGPRVHPLDPAQEGLDDRSRLLERRHVARVRHQHQLDLALEQTGHFLAEDSGGVTWSSRPHRTSAGQSSSPRKSRRSDRFIAAVCWRTKPSGPTVRAMSASSSSSFGSAACAGCRRRDANALATCAKLAPPLANASSMRRRFCVDSSVSARAPVSSRATPATRSRACRRP